MKKPANALADQNPGAASRFARKLHRGANYFRQHWMLYFMLLPGLFFLFVYKLLPLWGLQIAFKDYKMFAADTPWNAITASSWVGLKHFRKLFGSSQFLKVLRNTLEINFLKILCLFPLPILCAILLNEIRNRIYQKLCQTMIYVPYFFSWVLIFGIFYSLLGSYGIVNSALNALVSKRINFFGDQRVFRWILVFTEGWKEIGYNTVIYLAAITGIDTTLYEAAKMDGANKFSQIRHITLPGLLPTIVLMLILKVGYILTTGFEQVLVFYNPSVYDVADIIETYVYRIGLGQADFSLATALGLFNAVVAFILIIGANTVSKKTLGRSIW